MPPRWTPSPRTRAIATRSWRIWKAWGWFESHVRRVIRLGLVLGFLAVVVSVVLATVSDWPLIATYLAALGAIALVAVTVAASVVIHQGGLVVGGGDAPEPAEVSPPWQDDPLQLATDEQYATWYEKKIAEDPSWERALAPSLSADGLQYRERYERITGATVDHIGNLTHKGVDWAGYQRGSMVEVRGPFCPDDGRWLYHRSTVAPMDVIAKDDDRVGGMTLNELHCRDCDRTFDLETIGRSGAQTLSDPIQLIRDCRVDVIRQFVDQIGQQSSSA